MTVSNSRWVNPSWSSKHRLSDAPARPQSLRWLGKTRTRLQLLGVRRSLLSASWNIPFTATTDNTLRSTRALIGPHGGRCFLLLGDWMNRWWRCSICPHLLSSSAASFYNRDQRRAKVSAAQVQKMLQTLRGGTSDGCLWLFSHFAAVSSFVASHSGTAGTFSAGEQFTVSAAVTLVYLTWTANLTQKNKTKEQWY